MANECDEKTLRNLKAKEVFYQVSREGGREEGRGWREREKERITKLLCLLSEWAIKGWSSCVLFHCKEVSVSEWQN